ncbi:MAG: hypothetical protein E7473_07770 [Ruminococcaceae bacterium]|nr:hypothetical protein [Oscillospiraceae bacterium]
MKRILSLILVIAMAFCLAPTSFAANETEQGNGNEWVFNLASHGLTEETTMAPDNVTPFTLDTTVADISDKWEYINQASSSTRSATKDYLYWTKRNQSSAPVFNPDNNSTTNVIIFELVPDTSGTFNPSLSYISSTASASYDVYFFEKPHDIWKVSSTMTDGASSVRSGITLYIQKFPEAYIGNFDAYGNETVETIGFPKVTVTAGESYYFVLIANGRNDNWVSADSGNPTIALKLISFALKDETSTSAPFLDYNISLDSMTEAALDQYKAVQSATTYADIIDNKELAYVDWETGVLDLTKTEGFDMLGRSGRDNSPMLTSTGFNSEVNLAYKASGATEFTNYYEASITDNRPIFVIRLNVPYAGDYKLSLQNNFTTESNEVTRIMGNTQMGGAVADAFDEGAKTKVYFGKADDFVFGTSGSSLVISGKDAFETKFFSNSVYLGEYDSNVLAESTGETAVTAFETTVSCPVADTDYYILFDITQNLLNTKYWQSVSKGNTTYRQLFLLSGIELTPVDDNNYDEIQSSYDSIVNVDAGNAVEKTPANTTSNVKILCGADATTLKTEDMAVGAEIAYTAPKKDGYTFLYWAQGIGEYKKIVSYDTNLSLKAEKGPMWLTAVYADNSAEKTDVVFYNANGDEILRSQYEEDAVIILAALPSLAGFGTATGWTLDTDGETYTAADEVKASGRLMRFVAEYAEEPSETFEITVANGTVDNAAPVYGETVTATATLRDGTKLFNYWEKDGEIVSFDLSYSFKVWKDTTVTAVYKDYLPVADTVRKIILGTRPVGTETAVVAEFIGVSDVVEKGILFGTSLEDATHKVSMKTEGDTFSVIDDVTGDAIGYAILSNGNVIYSK